MAFLSHSAFLLESSTVHVLARIYKLIDRDIFILHICVHFSPRPKLTDASTDTCFLSAKHTNDKIWTLGVVTMMDI
jgi:hypothetical protein